MFQQTQPFVPLSDWRDTLSRGDVVLFRFPVAETNEETKATKPKLRPCLILDTWNRAGKRFISLAYGTSLRSRINRGYEIIVKNKTSLAAAGLDRATRFIGSRTVSISVDHPGFGTCDKSASPFIGRLDGALIERMNDVRARLQAEADMRAEARTERREEQRRWQREARGFLSRNHALGASTQP